MDDTPPALARAAPSAGHQFAGADAVDVRVARRRRCGRGVRRPSSPRMTTATTSPGPPAAAVPGGLLLPGRTRAGRRHRPGWTRPRWLPSACPRRSRQRAGRPRRASAGRVVGGGAWPESARRDPLRPCGRRGWSSAVQRGRGFSAPAGRFGSSGGLRAAIVARIGGRRRRNRPVSARASTAVAAVRVVVRGRRGGSGGRPVGASPPSDGGETVFAAESRAAVGHGVNPDLRVHGVLRCF